MNLERADRYRVRRRIRKRCSLLKQPRDIQSGNFPVRESPGRPHLPCPMPGVLTGRGRKYEIGSDAPSEAGLLFVRPRHHEQVQKLEVVERCGCCRAFVARNRDDLDRRPYQLFERRKQLRPNGQEWPKLQRVRLSIRAVFRRSVDVLDFELSQSGSRIVFLLSQRFSSAVFPDAVCWARLREQLNITINSDTPKETLTRNRCSQSYCLAALTAIAQLDRRRSSCSSNSPSALTLWLECPVALVSYPRELTGLSLTIRRLASTV